MTPVLIMLRSSMAFLRQCQRAMNRGDIAVAFQSFSMARHDLGYAIGLQSGHPSCERVRLCANAVEARLFTAIRRLAAAPADPNDLVADVAAGIDVLRTRDGVALDHTQVLDRARNVAAGLLGNYDMRARS
jgi:hypothetical protein